MAGAFFSRTRTRQPRSQEDKDLASRSAAAIAIVALATPAAIWQPISVHAPWIKAVGLVILVAATGFTIWARVTLGRFWSSAPVPTLDHALRTTGPYAITRHPIYSGIMVMMVGTACTQGLGRWLAIFAAVAIALESKMRTEERALSEVFGEEYARYRARVPRLIPRPLRRRKHVGAK